MSLVVSLYFRPEQKRSQLFSTATAPDMLSHIDHNLGFVGYYRNYVTLGNTLYWSQYLICKGVVLPNQNFEGIPNNISDYFNAFFQV